jgi:hypothetical protein
MGVPLPVVPGADEVPATEPESRKNNHLQTAFLTKTNLTSNSYFIKIGTRTQHLLTHKHAWIT